MIFNDDIGDNIKPSKGYVVNSRGITRRCRCSKSRKKCGWTSHTLQCVPEGSEEDIWNNFEVFTH